MQKTDFTAHPSAISEAGKGALPVGELERYLDAWISDGQYRFFTRETIQNRRNAASKFLWWVNRQKSRHVDRTMVRGFLQYLATGHEDEGGRWGNAQQTNRVKPGTAKTYFRRIHAFFEFLVEEGAIEKSPMDDLRPPLERADQKTPFTQLQVKAILAAADRQTRNKRRDKAIILVLLDTGIRATELCDLRFGDANLIEGYLTIRCGKGQKARRVPLHPRTRRAINTYLLRQQREPDSPLFIGTLSNPLTRSGLCQMVRRLGQDAGVVDIQCSPHVFRHSFAVEFLRGGGNVFTLQQMLGHTTLAMTQAYVAIAQADITEQHRRHSPVGSLYKGER